MAKSTNVQTTTPVLDNGANEPQLETPKQKRQRKPDLYPVKIYSIEPFPGMKFYAEFIGKEMANAWSKNVATGEKNHLSPTDEFYSIVESIFTSRSRKKYLIAQFVVDLEINPFAMF